MEDVFVFDSKTDDVFEDNPKVDIRAKNSIVNSGRKKLADISNMPRIPGTLTQDSKSRPNSSNVKEYIEQLQKENVALMKLLADQKIIDISGAELHKLRITLQKLQQQNLHLAQSNSQMLAELNSCKDRLKDLQHQLGCKNGLLIAKKLELEGKRKIKTCETNETKKAKVSEHEEMRVCKVAESGKDQHSNAKGRQKSKSLCPAVRKDQEKGVGDNERLVARRQSARSKHDEPKPAEDLFHSDDEIVDKMQEDDVVLPVKKVDDWLPSKVSQEGRRSSISRQSVVFTVKKQDDLLPNKASQEGRRSSILRPPREAAKKVQSYKEISLNIKMRRPE